MVRFQRTRIADGNHCELQLVASRIAMLLSTALGTSSHSAMGQPFIGQKGRRDHYTRNQFCWRGQVRPIESKAMKAAWVASPMPRKY